MARRRINPTRGQHLMFVGSEMSLDKEILLVVKRGKKKQINSK